MTFLGIIAWTASSFVVSVIITKLGRTPKVDTAIWLLVVAYLVLRIADESLWRFGEIVVRSFKPQMMERIRMMLFSETLKKPQEYYVNSSSGRIAHWVNTTTNTASEFVDTTIWTVWRCIIGLVVASASWTHR